MSSASLQLGGDNWAAKDGNLLGYQKSSSSSVHIPHEFTFTRGSNLAATRVAANGLIEKGRENLAKNTNWEGASLDTAPTNYTGYLLSNGTFNTTSTEGQIRFTTDSSSRAIVITSTISETGIFTQSVYVDEVYTSIAVIDIINRSANATAIAYYEDGVEITAATNVQAGKRYSILWNKTGAASFRFGSGVNTGKAGDIVLSRPQIEQGLVATELIVSPVGSTGLAGLLEDEPRIDYAGGTASLLLEPQRTNSIEYSEGILSLSGNATAEYDFTQESPTGLRDGVALISNIQDSTGDRIQYQGDIVGGNTYTGSMYIKGTSGKSIKYYIKRQGGTYVASVAQTITFDGTWQRIHSTFTSLADNTGARIVLLNDSSVNAESCYIWGGQLEEGSYPTSYIPTYGTSDTRAEDTTNEKNFSSPCGDSNTWFFELKRITDTSLSNQSIAIFKNDSTGANNRFTIYSTNNGRFRVLLSDEGGTTENLFSPNDSFEQGETIKAAVKITPSGCTLFVDGSSVATSSSVGTITGIDAITYFRKAALKQFSFFPTALTDAECITLTT